MKKLSTLILLTILAGFFPAVATADEEDSPFASQIDARQSSMTLYRYNLGLLGAMAKGDTTYDAKLATDATHNLLSLVNLRNSTMWPAGSDADAPGLADKTAAKAAIWSNFPEVGEKHQALTEAITEMSLVAGDGVDGIRATIGTVGKACKACHEEFRVPEDHDHEH